MRGKLEIVDANKVEGWAFDPDSPDQPVELELLDNGIAVARFLANLHRNDLEAAGVGRGHCAFQVSVRNDWNALETHVIQVRRARDGAELPGSPVTLARQEGFAPVREALANTLAGIANAGSAEDRETALRFLVNEVDRLLRARSDIDGTPPRADMAAFYQRWRSLLPDATPPVPRRPPERPGAYRRRALIITEAVADVAGAEPDPELRSVLDALVRFDHEVTIASGDFQAEPALLAGLEAKGLVYAGPPFTASVEETLRRQAGLFDIVVLNRLEMTLRYGALVRLHSPNARVVARAGPLQSVILSRMALDGPRPELANAAKRARIQETIAAWSAGTVFVSTETDARALREALPGAMPYSLDDPDARWESALRA
jgi:hypothetical protein